jgi:hypothetical protein
VTVFTSPCSSDCLRGVELKCIHTVSLSEPSHIEAERVLKCIAIENGALAVNMETEPCSVA